MRMYRPAKRYRAATGRVVEIPLKYQPRRFYPRKIVRPAQRADAETEFKSVDTAPALNVTTTGAIQLLNGMAPGSGIDQHTGTEVTMRSIQCSYIAFSTAATGIRQTHRLMLVYDRQCNATALTILQVLKLVTVVSEKVLENRRRFKILMDRTVDLQGDLAAGTGTSIVSGRFYRRLRHPITFNAGAAGTIADITTGSLYFIVIGTEPAGVTAGTVKFDSRIRYTDH